MNIDFEKEHLHVVLGGNGAVGSALINILKSNVVNLRTVEHSRKIDGVESVLADATNYEQLDNAVRGAEFIFMCIGLPYSAKVWERDWQKVVDNLIKICEKQKSKLVFLDNVYMYGPAPLKVPFDESHPQYPVSKKGKTRKLIADMLLDAHKSMRIKTVICRSADFYGPKAKFSPFYIAFLERMLANKAPQWLGNPEARHTYAFTDDNAKAMIELAYNDDTYGETWHLPVSEPVNIEQVLAIFNNVLGTDYKLTVLPKFMISLLSLFISPIREVKEMLYQFNHDYILSDNKFRTRFPDFKTTNYTDGIKIMIESFRKG